MESVSDVSHCGVTHCLSVILSTEAATVSVTSRAVRPGNVLVTLNDYSTWDDIDMAITDWLRSIQRHLLRFTIFK